MPWGAIVVTIITIGFLITGLIGPTFAQLRFRRTREPSMPELEQIETRWPTSTSMCDRVVIIETVGDASVEVAIRGVPGYRILFVTDYVLESLDGSIVEALFAAELARTKRWYREYQVLAATMVLALGSAAFLLVVPFELGFGAMLVLAMVLFAIGRTIQYRADAAAAAEVGTTALLDAFETVTAQRGIQPVSAGWRNLFTVQPRLGDRIERLREQG